MFTPEIGIDLGTANTLVVTKCGGIVVNEPSVVAVDRQTRVVVAVGKEAHRMLGRTPENLVSVRPLAGGLVANVAHSTVLLKHVIRKIAGNRWLRPRILIAVQSNASALDHRALSEAARLAGAGEVCLIDEAVAAGFGAGLPVEKPIGSLLVHIGGGNVEVAVISLGANVVSASHMYAGDAMDQAIITFMKRSCGLLIGAPTAEWVKWKLGSAMPGHRATMLVRGRSMSTGMPVQIEVSGGDIYEALKEPLARIDALVLHVLERTPPTLVDDIAKVGLTLTGGGALLHGLQQRLALLTTLVATVADAPLDAVAIGTCRVLKEKPRIRMFKIKP